MTTPVRDEPPPVAPEQLVLGPRPRPRRPRWVALVALILGLLIVGGATIWRVWPRPVEPLSLDDLQDTYAGMVRSDGSNEASVVTRHTVAETPVTVNPAECSPLVQATFANRFPDAALDGVGAYWIEQTSTISLFTLRFENVQAASAERTRIMNALDACADREVLVRRSQQTAAPWQATVGRTVAGSGGDDQLGYALRGPDGVMAIQLMRYANTLTWQSRYETGTSYSPLSADGLMQSLHKQLDAVVAARPR